MSSLSWLTLSLLAACGGKGDADFTPGDTSAPPADSPSDSSSETDSASDEDSSAGEDSSQDSEAADSAADSGSTDSGTPPADPDSDGDGFSDSEDCEPDDSETYPGAPEDGAGLMEDPACDGGGGDLSAADLTFTGRAEEDYAGWSVAGGGDVDGDGLSDLLIGAPHADRDGAYSGEVYLFLGKSLGDKSLSEISLDDADLTLVGEGQQAYAGNSLDFADVDGDGLSDLLIGSYGYTDRGAFAGQAYLVLGSTLGAWTEDVVSLGMADYHFLGGASRDYAGSAVSSAGDINGDGRDELLIGAYMAGGAGQVYLYFGSSFGGPTSGSWALSDADRILQGEEAGDYAGWSLASAGDVDGDGADDVLVGAQGRDGSGVKTGKAYLISGYTLGESSSDVPFTLDGADWVLCGEESDDWAGSAVSSAGDVDGDGLADVLVGAQWNDDGGDSAGKAYLLLGQSILASSSSELSLADADYSFAGEGDNHGAGDLLSSAGDVDGDGLGDFLIAASGDAQNGSYSGKAYLLLGGRLPYLPAAQTSLSDAHFTFLGEGDYTLAGSSVSSAGDVDGDGLSEVLIGAVGASAGSYHGEVYLLFGQD